MKHTYTNCFTSRTVANSRKVYDMTIIDIATTKYYKQLPNGKFACNSQLPITL